MHGLVPRQQALNACAGADVAWLAVTGGGSIVVVVGLVLGWSGRPTTRRHGWEVQAVGLAIIAAGWLGALASAGHPAG